MKLKQQQYQIKLSISFESFVFFQSQTSNFYQAWPKVQPRWYANMAMDPHLRPTGFFGDGARTWLCGTVALERWRPGHLGQPMHHALCHRQGSHGGWNMDLWRLGDLKVQWPVVDAESQKGDSGVFSQYTWAKQDCRPQNPCFECWFHEDHKQLQLHACFFFLCFPKDLITRPSWERCGAPHFMTCPGSHQCAKYLESEKNRGGHACSVILPDISKRVLKIPGLGLIHCAESIRSYLL